jgi:hypothetical protein
VIARAGSDGSILSLASGDGLPRNVVVWAEWDTNPGPEVIAEWFPQLMGTSALPEHLQPRPYKTSGDETVAVLNVTNPALGLMPAVVFLHDAGDDADAGAVLLEEVDGAVGFLAEWRAIDPMDPATFVPGLHDVACLLRYVRSEGGRFGADPARVTIAGHGAGGLMAAAAALSPVAVAGLQVEACAHWEDPAVVTGAVAIGGFFDRPDDLSAIHPAMAAVFDPPQSDSSMWFGLVRSEADVEADFDAIADISTVLRAAGHESEVTSAEGDHDQLLNARHPLQGIPSVRAIETAIKRD